MSHVYIVTQTEYKHYEDYENEENRNVAVLYVYATAKAANEAAKEWVEEYFEDGDNEVQKDDDGCDTWTCTLERDDQSHVLTSVLRTELYGELEEGETSADDEEIEADDGPETQEESGSREAQGPPAKRAREE